MTTQELAHKSLEDIRYHYVSDFLEGTKRISLTLYDHTGLSFPSLEKRVAAINGTAEPYLHKAAQLIDQRLDTAIKNSKQLVGMTKKSLKKIPHDEKLIVQLVKTWLANHLTVGKEGIVQTLSEFVNSLNKETAAKLHLDKIKARIGTFYGIASTAWEKLVERNHNDIKRVILEITATSLAKFDNVPTDEHMIACLVNTGEKVMDEKRWITLEEFIPHITLSHAEGDEDCKQAQLKLVEKFFHALKQYGKILSASRGINEKVTSACSKNDTTNKWFELVKTKGEDAFSALEHLTAKLHSSVVPSSIAGEENINGKSSLVVQKHEKEYGNRARNILVQLNEVRLALQLKATQLPPTLIAQGQVYVQKLSQLFYYSTMVTLQTMDQVYIPIQQNFYKLATRRDVVAIKLYLGDKANKAMKMLNDNEKFTALKQCAEIKLAETQIRFKIETVKWKTRSEEVKRDVTRLLTELAIILRENKKMIPSRVYSLALDTIRGRLQSRPALPPVNGVAITPKNGESEQKNK